MARMQADMVQTGAFTATEFTTFTKAGLFTDWAAGQTYAKGLPPGPQRASSMVMQEVTAIENQPRMPPGCWPCTAPVRGPGDR